MAQYTSDEGVYLVWEAISVLEQITAQPWEHSASENLYVRKLHYTKKRTAGYSFYPIGGWTVLWNAMGDAIRGLGGTILQPATVRRVLVEDAEVRGVELHDGTVVEAREVVVTVPVWNLPRLFDDGALPWDLLARIELLRKNKNRACWLGWWIAAKEPVIAMTEREMASFFSTPRTGLPGFTLNFTGYDPSVSPPGEYLTCVGAAFDAVERFGDRAWLERKFHELWLDIEEMLPMAKHALWTKKHLVTTYGVINKPGLVGPVRPDVEVRGVGGLWLAGDTTRSRGVGIDKAARTGITAAEAVLGASPPPLRRHRPLLTYPRTMARIELPEGDGRDVLRALSVRPELRDAFVAMNIAIHSSPLEPRLHELVRYRVAELNQCTYCMAWRSRAGQASGVTDDLLGRVSGAATDPAFTEPERLALEYTERFCGPSTTIDDELVDRLRAHLGDDGVVELTLAIGKYMAFGRFMQVLQLDQACAVEPEPAGVAAGP